MSIGHPSRTALVVAALFVAIGAASCGPRERPAPGTPAPPTGAPAGRETTATEVSWSLEPAWDGLEQPIGLTHAGDGTGRVFIVEKSGRIRLVKAGKLAPEPFLDVSDRVSTGSEQGLLGVAFPPGFEEAKHFYIDYTDRRGDTHIARVDVSGDPDRADPGSLETVLSIDQPYSNHNGGQIAFGPDGYLYIGMGDGGSAGDPDDRAQDRGELLGKLLRIDVEGGSGRYTVPASNPFVGDEGRRPEIWAYGLRNPWRFSFDRETGDLWIGDVGQNAWEEIDFQPSTSRGGENYGWPRFEGAHLYDSGRRLVGAMPVPPVAEFSHATGRSITGGYRYRGSDQPGLRGRYVYGDFDSGIIISLTRDGSEWREKTLLDSDALIASFGEDERGELYVCDMAGAVYRLVGTPESP